MDPFRYHDTKEERIEVPVLPKAPDNPSNLNADTTTHRVIKTQTLPAGPGRFIITTLVETLPRPILGPERNHSGLGINVAGNRKRSSSLASSPPSISSSPPSSVNENGIFRRNSDGNFADGFQSFCSFCKKNGERPNVYNSHQLRCFDSNGRRVVSCFVLRSVRCSICGATGDNAHTISHCPVSPRRVPIALALKTTPRQCDGTFRKRQEFY